MPTGKRIAEKEAGGSPIGRVFLGHNQAKAARLQASGSGLCCLLWSVDLVDKASRLGGEALPPVVFGGLSLVT